MNSSCYPISATTNFWLQFQICLKFQIQSNSSKIPIYLLSNSNYFPILASIPVILRIPGTIKLQLLSNPTYLLTYKVQLLINSIYYLIPVTTYPISDIFKILNLHYLFKLCYSCSFPICVISQFMLFRSFLIRAISTRGQVTLFSISHTLLQTSEPVYLT